MLHHEVLTHCLLHTFQWNHLLCSSSNTNSSYVFIYHLSIDFCSRSRSTHSLSSSLHHALHSLTVHRHLSLSSSGQNPAVRLSGKILSCWDEALTWFGLLLYLSHPLSQPLCLLNNFNTPLTSLKNLPCTIRQTSIIVHVSDLNRISKQCHDRTLPSIWNVLATHGHDA